MALTTLLLAAACGGGGGGGGGAIDPSTLCNGTDTRFAGFVQYQDRPYNTNGFGDPVMRPVRYARVAMIDGELGNVLGSATTDGHGAYCIDVDAGLQPASALLRVRAVAEPPEALPGQRVTVSPAPDGNPAYVFEVSTDPIGVIDRIVNRVPTFSITQNTLMPTGPFIGIPVTGAFNIMDVVTYGYQAIHTAWGVRLPALKVEWHPEVAVGTHYHGGDPATPGQVVMHISGSGGGDSDEYDDDTVLHEFGHFVYDQVGRSDSPGGQHFINGYTQDARLAYSEGWASFMSAMIRDILPVAASNGAGPEWMISAFSLTEGAQSALAWAYEMENATALVADTQTPNYDLSPVGEAVFRHRVKTTTSEVSVSAALWDLYRGVGGAEGIGTAGIYDALLAMSGPDIPQTFGAFWEWLEGHYPTNPAWLEALRAHLATERKMGLEDDVQGADDTPEELAAQVAGGTNHLIQGVSESRTRVLPVDPQAQFTLFPEGDVDLYRFQADTAGTYGIVTYDLSNGADTFMELIDDATGATVAANDNYEVLAYRYWYGTDTGTQFGVYVVPQDYGNCGLVAIQPEGSQVIYLPGCPPNAANYPAQDGSFVITEYLASRIEADLAAGTYTVRVSRSPIAPPSADIHGAYRLCAEKVNLTRPYLECPRNLTVQ